MSSSIRDGAELTQPVRWQAYVTGVPASDVAEVRFLIDGQLRYLARMAPYVFAGRGNLLLPGTLAPGSHIFAVDVTLTSGYHLTTAATAVVSATAPGVRSQPQQLRRAQHRREHETSIPRPSAAGLAGARRPGDGARGRLFIGGRPRRADDSDNSHPAAASALDSQRTAYGSVVLDGSPGTPAVNARTGTLYVPIQCTTSFCGPDKPGHVMDVINAATCNAKVRSGCQVVARAKVGSSPTAAVVDDQTGTVYVTNSSDGTVSVVNEARCNARVTSGCAVPRATIKLGGFLVAAAVNPVTRTLYVADLKGGVFVVDAAACNAVSTRGCTQAAREVKDSQGPAALDIDLATNTVYAVNNGDSDNGDTVSVINGANCNGTHGSGCGQAPPATKVGSGAFWAAVDQAHHTVYVANDNDGTVSVINGARCNARVTSGCGSTWPTVTTGANPEFVALDPSSGTVFTVNHFDDTLSVINTKTCNGTTTSGCAGRARNEQATPVRNPGFNSFPNELALVPQTGSAYVVNVGGANVVSVVSVSHCNASDTTGCRTEAPSVPAHEATISADLATGTIYASNTSRSEIDVLNAATCRTGNLTGCAPVAEIPVATPDGQRECGR